MVLWIVAACVGGDPAEITAPDVEGTDGTTCVEPCTPERPTTPPTPGTDSDTGTSTTPPEPGDVRPTGTLSLSVDPSCQCDAGTVCDCFSFSVADCGALVDDLPAAANSSGVVRVSVGSGSTTQPQTANVFSHKGSDGTSFWDGDLYRDLVGDYRMIQIRWDAGWMTAHDPLGPKAAACRPATVVREFLGAAQQLGFDYTGAANVSGDTCTISLSGGSGAMAYSMAHYGLEDTVDYMLWLSGPPMTRLDAGCYPDEAGEPEPVFGGRDPAVSNRRPWETVALPASVDTWMAADQADCTGADASAQNVAALAAMSIDSPGADWNWGIRVDGFWCTYRPNGTFGGGAWLIDALQSGGNADTVAHWYDNTAQDQFAPYSPEGVTNPDSTCVGEKLTDDASARADVVSILQLHCG